MLRGSIRKTFRQGENRFFDCDDILVLTGVLPWFRLLVYHNIKYIN